MRAAESQPGETAPPFTLGRRPGLDGVRAIAIAAVFAFHFRVAHSFGGYLGVDVFFVLSGFLITALLVQERTRKGGISLRAFYLRRARRLFPALYILLITVTVYAAVRPHQVENQTVRRDVLGSLFYVTNWINASVGFQPVRMLSHTWSLAIEEQFYLLWPAIVVVLLWRRAPRWAVVSVAIGGVVLSAVDRAILVHHYGNVPRVAQGLDTRGAGGLLLGCTLGLLVAWRLIPAAAERFAAPGAVVGLALLIFAFVGPRYADARTTAVYYDGLPLVALGTALLIFGVLFAPSGIVTRVLSLPPMVWIGRVSYGLYLWHVPVSHIFRPSGISVGLEGNALRLFWLAVTLLVVTASFYLVEQPILHGQWPGRRRPQAPAAAPTPAS
jgi:peptidoglycan/LPS O-acetylase OafA/YrhL